VRVRMHEPLALEHLDERLELEVAPRRHETLLAFRDARLVIVPRPLVILRPRERVAQHFLLSHATRWIPRRLRPLTAAAAARILPRDILAERELDSRRRVGEQHLGNRAPPFQLYDGVLPADRVGRSV